MHLFSEYEIDQRKKVELQRRNQSFGIVEAVPMPEPEKKVKTDLIRPPQSKEEIESDLKERQELHHRMMERELERRKPKES